MQVSNYRWIITLAIVIGSLELAAYLGRQSLPPASKPIPSPPPAERTLYVYHSRH